MNFGILCNGKYFQQWQLDSIKLLISDGHNCALLIENGNPQMENNIWHKVINYPYSKFIVRAWFRFMMKPGAKTMVDISSILSEVRHISCVTTKKGYSEYFHASDIENIKSYKLDFILRYGFGILKGEILEAAKYGVWSYHHDDDRKYRGVPTGFWEIWFNDPINAAILQRLTSQIDSGVVLRKAYFASINHSWQANLDNLLKSSAEWPKQVCRDIENGNTGFLNVKNSPGTEIYKMPGNIKMLRFLLKLFLNKLRFHFRDLFLTEKWNIGIIQQPVAGFLKNGEHTIPKPFWLNTDAKKSTYHADPFGFVKDKCVHIVCEEYDYERTKGILVSFEVDNQTYKVRKKALALEKDYHLAFPFLFESEGNYYCVPENSEGRNVDLYKFDELSGKLIFINTLIENLQAVDPALFYFQGYWWLFFTDRFSTNERLNIWYSFDINGPYKPHSNNPVKVDIRSSRPAGNLFILDGKLLRPSQDCSIRSGRRICINEVIRLTPTEFEEKEFCILNADPDSGYPDGMHTFCMSDDIVIVDGKRECFIWQAFVNKISHKFTKIISRI